MKSSLCEECGMTFQTGPELQNHLKKFCRNSKYSAIDNLQKQFQQASKDRDISKFGKMALSMRGKTYDFQKNIQNTNKLEYQYRNILKQIDDQKNMKNKLQLQRRKAFHQLQALQKQQQQLIIDDKYTNLQSIITKKQQLKKQQQQLQKQLKQYQLKKNQWNKSQAKIKQIIDQPYQQGKIIGKITFERTMLEQKKHNMELQLNAKRRQKQKLQSRLLQMSAAQQPIPSPKKSKAAIQKQQSYPPPPISPQSLPPQQLPFNPLSNNPSQLNNPSRLNNPSQSNYTKMPRDRAIFTSQISKTSSYLHPSALNGSQKILKFNLNKQGKSQQDKLIQSIMAQQYDDLMILSKLPKNSQLYTIKLKQYQQLSKQRMQVQQKAQKQRIQKMKRQFEFQKLMNQKQKLNIQWVDNTRKVFIKKQMAILHQPTQQQQYPQQQQLQQQQSIHKTNNSIELQPSNNNIQSNQSNQSNHSMSIHLQHQTSNLTKNPPILQSKSSIKQKIKSSASKFSKKPPPSSSTKDQFGYRISILSLKNYSLKKPIKIKLILYQQFYHQNQLTLKYQFNTIYHDQNANQLSPDFKNKLDSYGAIAYNQTFYVPENLQSIYSKNQKQIYLMLVAAQKDQRKISNQGIPYSWYCFKITHFGQIKQGRYNVNLYADNIIYPYPADMNKMKNKKQQQVLFELQQVLLNQSMIQSLKKNQSTKQNKVQISKKSNPRSKTQNTDKVSIQNNLQKQPKSSLKPSQSSQQLNSSKMEMNYPIKMKNIGTQEVIKINQQYFYSNEKPTQFTHIQMKKPLNFDIFVTGLRTLPSYVGPIKLQISLIDIDNVFVVKKQQFLSQIGNDLYNPIIDFTKQIRNESRISPSTIIFIRLITISALDYQIYSLGFTLVYLFLDKLGNTIKKSKLSDYYMVSGFYQLPIFWGNIQPQYLDINHLLTNYPPIPCASILIGIMENASKISNPPPSYHQKLYNTILFQIDQNQAKLFQQQYKRQPLDSNTLITNYLQYKGIKKKYSGQQVLKYLNKTLTFSSQNTKNQFELKWMSQYQQYFGINFILDKLTIPQQNKYYYYFITICISPPGQYYKKKSFDLLFCRKINFEQSKINQFYFKDNQFFINPIYFKNTSIIIQVNRIQIFQNQGSVNSNNIQGYAYTVIPLFQLQHNIKSVNAMQCDIVLCDGDFDTNSIQKVQKNLPVFLQSMNKSKRSKASISIRLLNGYFMNQYLPPQPDPSDKTPLYKNIASQHMDFNAALEHCMNVIGNNYNLQINDF